MAEFILGLFLGLSLVFDPVAAEKTYKAAHISALETALQAAEVDRIELRDKALREECRLQGHSDYGWCPRELRPNCNLCRSYCPL